VFIALFTTSVVALFMLVNLTKIMTDNEVNASTLTTSSSGEEVAGPAPYASTCSNLADAAFTLLDMASPENMAATKTEKEAATEVENKTSILTASLKRKQRRLMNKKAMEKKRKRFMSLLERGNTAECFGPFSSYFKIENYLEICYGSGVRIKGKRVKAYKELYGKIKKAVHVNRMYMMPDVNKKIQNRKMDRKDSWDVEFAFESVLEDTPITTRAPWFQVRSSTLKDAGLGCFANREFHRGECMGLYMGELKTLEDATHVSEYAIRSAPLGLCDPLRGFRSSNPAPFYGMGVHMINDPRWGAGNPGETEDEMDETEIVKPNAYLTGDFLLYADMDIKMHEEIFIDYCFSSVAEGESKPKAKEVKKRKLRSQKKRGRR
jgi:hypothetical protein